MSQYDSYSNFYDATQQGALGEHYLRLLQKYHPNAKSLLEIACGTGSLLLLFSKHYDVAGLDISKAMLELARKKLPNTKFYQQDMAGFDVGRTFDVVVCPYDSINHLLSFNGWMKTFKATKRHLNPRGVFVFDINTQFRLRQLTGQPPFVQEFDDNTMIMNISDAGKGITDWEVRVFEHEKGSRFRLHREIIRETSFPNSRIREALEKLFNSVRVFNMQEWSRPKKDSGRLFYVCSDRRL